MPHCIIEYSEGVEAFIDPSHLLTAAYRGALASQLFEEPDIKTRAISYKHYQIGAFKKEFVHINIKILSGRTTEQRHQLSAAVLKELQTLSLRDTSLTIEVCDIEKHSYEKSTT